VDPKQDVNSGASSSPDKEVSSQDVNPQAAPSIGQDVNNPTSSSGTPAEETKADLLSVVMQAAPPKEEDDVLASPATSDKPEPEPGSPAKDEPSPEFQEPTAEELKAYTPKAQDRIRELVQRGKQFQAERDALRGELETLQPLARQFQDVQGFIAESRISEGEFGQLLTAGAALKRGDFNSFLQAVRPYVQYAEEAMGVRLPDDLRQQVDNGLMPEDAARELVRSRHQANIATAQVQELSQTQAVERQQAAATSIRTAVATWETGVQARDPDYGAKQAAVQRYAQALIAEHGAPRSPQEALSLAEKALDEVNKTFTAFRPAPKPTLRVPTGGQTPTNALAPEPKSLMDAVLQGLQRTRAS
jgi:hypothetical protein